MLLFIFLFSCASDESARKTETEDKKENSFDINEPSIIKINNRLFSIPSPIQVSILAKETELTYNGDLLNKTSNVAKYNTNVKKALNLGIYGANLGYLSIYERFESASEYFATVRELTRDLGLDNYFDKPLIDRIEAHKNNKDTLVQIMTDIYQDVDAFLLKNDRNELGILILAGGWVESLYLMTQSIEDNKNELIVNRIGEQKYPLENIIDLLRPFYNKRTDELNTFIESLVDLAIVYDGVVIDYHYEPPDIFPEKRLTVINSTSQTIISDYQLNAIRDTIAKIRSSIIN